MKLISWNCRGLGNQTIIRALKKFLLDEKPDILFLMETKIKVGEMRKLNEQKLKFKGCLAVDCETTNYSRKGGLCMMWGENYSIKLLSYSLHHIICKVEDEDSTKEWLCSGIYGWPQTYNKMRTWELLQYLKQTTTLLPWVCFGDFNEIMWSREKAGGNQKSNESMNEFRTTLQRCELSDLGYIGTCFTWSNGRKGRDNILERLDTVTATEEWKVIFPYHQVRHLPRFKSDHAPIILDYGKEGCSLKSPVRCGCFKFEHMWLQNKDFTDVLKDIWRSTGLKENIMEKLQGTGEALQKWASNVFGSVRKKKKKNCKIE